MTQENLSREQKRKYAEYVAEKLIPCVVPYRPSIKKHAKNHYDKYITNYNNQEIQLNTNFQQLHDLIKQLYAINIKKELIRNIMWESPQNKGQLQRLFDQRKQKIQLVIKLRRHISRKCNFAISYNGKVLGGWRSAKSRFAMLILRFQQQYQNYCILSFYLIVPNIQFNHKFIRIQFKVIEQQEAQKQSRRTGIFIKRHPETRIKQRKAQLIEQYAQMILADIQDNSQKNPP